MFPYSKQTALHWAAKHGNEEMATLVVNAGGDVNIKSVSAFFFPLTLDNKFKRALLMISCFTLCI